MRQTYQLTSHDQHACQVVLYIQVKALLSHHLDCRVKRKKGVKDSTGDSSCSVYAAAASVGSAHLEPQPK